MASVTTIFGLMDDSLLARYSGTDENENAWVDWIEYRIKDDPTKRIVHRSVHVRMKVGINTELLQGMVGG